MPTRPVRRPVVARRLQIIGQQKIGNLASTLGGGGVAELALETKSRPKVFKRKSAKALRLKIGENFDLQGRLYPQ
jgi:hypothetical protein